MRIYKSNVPPTHIPQVSIASFLYPPSDNFSPSAPAFIDAKNGNTLTRGDLRLLSSQLGWGLRNGLVGLGGVKLSRGDTVTIFSPNCLAYPIALHGCFMAGLRVVVANPSSTPRELSHQYHDSGSRTIFAHSTVLETVLSMLRDMGVESKQARQSIILLEYDSDASSIVGFAHLEQLLGRGRLCEEERFEGPLARETALICYSSGTTGNPKGVELMHSNLVAMNLLIAQAFALKHHEDRVLGFIPFYHIYGAVILLQCLFTMGVPVYIMDRFDPVDFLRNIEAFKITFVTAVPPILVILASHPAVQQYNLTSMKRLACGAAPLSAALQQAVVDRLGSLGAKVTIVQGYGLTEAAPATNFYGTQDADRKVGTVGKIMSGMEARLILEDGVTDAPEGEQGELWLRGPVVMKGYVNNPSATRDCLTEDGWLKSGDVATIDNDGYVKIVDRRKELIKYKAFQVPPAELEGVLMEHPKISDAGVIGIYSEAEATELPRAYVVHTEGLQTDEEKEVFAKHVQEWVKGRVARQKYLRGGVLVVDAIPKSPSGKILRRELRERAKADAENSWRHVHMKSKL